MIIKERYIKFDDVDYDRYNRQNKDFPAGGTDPFIIPKAGTTYDFAGFQNPVMVGDTNIQGKKIRIVDCSFGGVNPHKDKSAYIEFCEAVIEVGSQPASKEE